MDFWDEYNKALQGDTPKSSSGGGSGGGSSGGSGGSDSFWDDYYRAGGHAPTSVKRPTIFSKDYDIAPFSRTITTKTHNKRKKNDEEEEEERKKKRKWYKKGHFEDGYDIGDITKTILGIDEDTASLKDLTWGSAKRGYYNSLYGEETFKEMNGQKNQKDVYKQILDGDEYQFSPGNDAASAVSGAMELIGQQFRQYTNPRTLAFVGTAAGGAFAAGQAGPQVLVPEEIITVPSAAMAGLTIGSSMANLEIEAGHAYNEMIEAGISEETARKVATGVGAVNAGLEMLQVDELIDAYKVTKASGATKSVTKKILDELVDRGIDVAKETAQEVAQESVTIAGTQFANKKDKGEFAYSAEEVDERLKDTAKSSALSFGLMNVPATAKNTYSIIKDNKKAPVNQAVQNEHPVVEQKVVKETKPEVDEVKPVEHPIIEQDVKTEEHPIVEQKVEPEIKPEVEEVKPLVEQTEVKPPEKKVLYTGSPNTDIKQFKVGGGERQTGDRYGRGIYLTTNEGIAKNYAGENGRVYQTSVDDLDIFNLNDKITPGMKENLVFGLRDTDPQYRNSVLRNFRSEQVFEDTESAEAFLDQQEAIWKEQDGVYDANKPVVKDVDNATGKAVIEFTDFSNWENVIGDLTGSQLYDALKSLSTDDFSSFITANGFDGISFDEDADNQQYVIYRNEDRIKIDEPVVENSTVEQETQLTEENSTVSENSNPELVRMIAERDSLQATLMDRYNKKLFNEETERLANEWSKLNYQIESMKASQASVESVSTTPPVDSDTAIPPVVEDSIASEENIEASSFPEQAISEPIIEEATQEAEQPKTTAEKARDYYRDGLLSFDRVFPNEEKTPEKHARFESLKKATKDAQDFIANGAEGVKPLAEIFRKVSEDGTFVDFELYLRHLLNIDRTTLEERFDKENLPVFGEEEWNNGKRRVKWFVNAEQSREKVAELEKAHPEFVQYREDVYAFNNHLNKMLVDNENITQETAKNWAERYPHYIPISRSRHSEQVSEKLFKFLNSGFGEYTYKEDGFALFEKDVLVAEPLHSITATGEDFHPLIDTMVDRALRTYWTVADNQFEATSDFVDEDYQADPEAPFAEPVDDVISSPEPVVESAPIVSETEAPIESVEETSEETEMTQEEFDTLNELGQELVAKEENQQEAPIDSTEETINDVGASEDVAPDTTDVEQSAPIVSENTTEDAQAEATQETNEEETQNEAEEIDIEPAPERRDDLLHKRFGLFQALSVFGVDDGLRFEIIGKKEGVRLDAGWHAIRNSFGSAQHFIGHGKADSDVKSLSSIVDKVTSKKLTKEFDSYLRHLRNIDNMSLESRYVVAQNNSSIGCPLSVSYREVRLLEAKHPEFVEWASECYENADYIRQQFVKHGLITQDDADLWKELFPHWMPFRRDNTSYKKFMNGVQALQKHNFISGDTASKMKMLYLTLSPTAEQGGKALPMLETMAQFTSESFHSWSMNDFAVQLKDVLHTDLNSEGFKIDDFIRLLDNGVSLFEFDKSGDYYTCTTYQNGEKVTFEIDKEMYIAMSDSYGWMNMKIPVLHQINEGFRKLCTEWNIFFSLKNGVKDPQDIIYNSQHPLETYAELAHAAEAIAFKESAYRPYYEEYLANGGEPSTYFDNESGKFNSWTHPSEFIQYATGLKTVMDINNRVETNPRLAEYIASRKAGKSVKEAMLDSARVTTNFAAGGKFTKFLNRNGCTFLNASVQGALQHARNFAEAATDSDGKLNLSTKEAKLAAVKGTTALIARGLMVGMAAIAINDLRWKDDEDYEALPDYVKDGYYLLFKFGDGQFFRLPKGRTNATIEKGLRTVAEASFGDDNADWNGFFDTVMENIAPNSVFKDNIAAPIREVGKGETWYGEDMIPYRLKDKDTVDQFDEKTDTFSIELSKKLEDKLNDITIDEWLNEKLDGTKLGEKLAGFRDGLSPKEINYLINSYTGVLGDLVLPYKTPKAESPYDNPLGQSLAPLKDIFTTDSVLNNRVTGDFYETLETAEAKAESKDATQEDKFRSGLLISYNVELSELYNEQRKIQMDKNLSDSEKYERTREIKKEINALQEEGLKALEDYSIDGNYAESGDKRYNYSEEDDTWWEVKPKLADGRDNWYYTEEQMFHDNLGVSYSDYWNGRLNPEDYDVKTLYDERNGKRYNFDMENNAWFEIKPKTKEGKDNYYYQREQTAHDKWGVSYEDFWNNREAYMDAIYVAENGVENGWGKPYYETVKTAIGLDTFTQFSSEMADIRADTKPNGDYVSGSKYRKLKNFVYDLDIPEVQKHILFKAEYPDTNKHNNEIIDYLNERDDISYEEMESILTELGFKVDKKGNITW